jgi:hypothetical protein
MVGAGVVRCGGFDGGVLPPAQDASRPADDEGDEEDRPGLSLTRQAAPDALRAESDRTITYGRLATLASSECCACGLGSAPAICEECPNLHLLRAVLRRQPRCA